MRFNSWSVVLSMVLVNEKMIKIIKHPWDQAKIFFQFPWNINHSIEDWNISNALKWSAIDQSIISLKPDMVGKLSQLGDTHLRQ